MRINITGNAGAGKTTLAKELSFLLHLPCFSLDSIVWQSGWGKTPYDQRTALEAEQICKPKWVIDGVSINVRAAADIVIFLDEPRFICAWRALRRSLKYFFRTRPEMPLNCPEWRIIPTLIRIIWRFPTKAGLLIREEALQYPSRYIIIKNKKELEFFLPQLFPS